MNRREFYGALLPAVGIGLMGAYVATVLAVPAFNQDLWFLRYPLLAACAAAAVWVTAEAWRSKRRGRLVLGLTFIAGCLGGELLGFKTFTPQQARVAFWIALGFVLLAVPTFYQRRHLERLRAQWFQEGWTGWRWW